MNRLYLLLLVLGVLLASPGRAQSLRTITGTVTASADRTPLPGVTVLVKGTTTGASTGPDGRFTVQAAPGSTLIFSFIGYTSQERVLGDETTLEVGLKENATELNDVIVTAYGIKQERRQINYAVQEVKAKDIIESRQNNIVNALQGKVAGVSVNSAGGGPGEGAAIVIRGGTSLDGDNQPLFVIDGVIMDNSSFVESTNPGGGSAFNGILGRSVGTTNRAADINPEDIASMTVLKGPAAATLYGLRAANGAVIITTKRGQSGRTSIVYRAQYSIDEVNRLPKLQGRYQQGSTGQFDPTTRRSWGPQFADGQPIYNNLEDFFRTGKAAQHFLTASGGTDKATFLVSASRLDQTGVVPGSKYDKTSLRLNSTVRLTPKIGVEASANYLNSGGERPVQGPGLFGSSGGYLVSILNWPRNDDMRVAYNPNGSRRRLLGAFSGAGADDDADNPYWTVEQNPQTDRTNRFIGNATATYDPLEWLGVRYTLGTDFYQERTRSVRAVGTSLRDNQNGGIAETVNFNRVLNSNLLVTARHRFSENLNSTLVVGNTVEQNKNEANDFLGLIFATPNFVGINNTVNRNVLQRFSTRRLVGNFGRLNVDAFNQVFLELQGRYDMSSTLPRPDKKKNFGKGFGYGSVALGYEFTRTLGLGQSNILNYGKLRGSYANVGKDTSPYRVDSPLVTATYIGGGYRNGFFGSNPILKPERTGSFEAGLDLQFFQNRLGLDMNVYQSITSDQLIAPRVSQAAGFILQYINGGKVRNRGIEVALSGTPVKLNNGFSWDVLANFYRNENRTLALPSVLSVVYQSDAFVIDFAEGGAFPDKALTSIGASDWNYVTDASSPYYGQRVIGASGYPTVNANFVYAGNRAPDYTLQVTNTFAYKGLSLAFLADFRKGGLVVNGNDWSATRSGLSERTLERGKQVTFPGVVATTGSDGTVTYTPNTRTVELSETYYRNILGTVGTAFIEDGSWARLRYATFSYTLPAKLLGDKIIKGVELSVTGRNLVLFTPYSGVDPETAAAGAGVRGGGSSGFDYGGVPATRGVDMGLRVSF
ncbi:TonB-linked outer membrane protein, SusC/RagA family [Hymenobacter daecheongensis DSM 21074]|uniref:TonB-linked outer membrane protein, SusC/RagA family n=1 Tax=Hymenobacter daecheongensis DSM 21074 TaxID=1121955 RepID=A0A1M6LQF2_9BACT|nr:SusC/RagA family TonB-linked outer membrane protein [Hymenobacter daecheongensis]SHJ73426.1 TonB-linked outer membrane protein, SusC/RagA family [Hymenobacter daecheongensis DSM 21074]